MPITTLPAVPTIDDPQNFATEADAFLGALPTFVTEANTLATQVQNNATTASTAATSATTAASTASAAVTTAANSATSAAGSASSASTSATNAAASASTATTQATNAATSATNASTSAASASAIVTSSASNRPSIRPSLLLDFSNTKVLDPRITFARNSIGTYFGNTQHKCEENLLPYSEQFDVWTLSAVSITPNSITAPNAVNSADTVTAGGTNTAHGVSYVTSSTAGSIRTFSVYAKAGTNDFIQLLFNTDLQAYANFNISTGTVGTVGSSASATVVSVGNSWYRCSITTTSATAGDSVYINLVSSNTAARYESNTLSTSVYLWGGQVEYRNYTGGHISTSGSPINTYMTTLQQVSSGIPRFDHDPITGESKGLLVEKERSNLLTYSSDFNNAAWTKVRASLISNYAVAPDGTLTADKLVEDTTATNSHYTCQTCTATNQTITYSIFVKASEKSSVQLGMSNNTNEAWSVSFNLNTGAVIGTPSLTDGTDWKNKQYFTPINIGNGWWRVSISASKQAVNTVVACEVYIHNGTTSSYTGDGVSGIYVWGAQLEAGTSPTSYIPTTSAAVQRASEVAYISGNNFSSWYRQGEGSMYSEYNITYNGSPESDSCWYFQNSDFTGRFGPVISSGSKIIYFEIVVPSGYTAIPHNNTLDSVKHSVAFKVNDVATTANGTTIGTDTSASIPVVDRVYIGSRAGGAQLNGCIKRIAYYPKRLTNTELQTLST